MSDSLSAGVVRKIRALLAKTVESGCTEEEASAAVEKAQEILAAHNVSLSQLESDNGPTSEGRAKEKYGLAMEKWRVDLMSSVARANFCKHWIEPAYEIVNGESVLIQRHMLIGREVNTMLANSFYAYLSTTIERLNPYSGPAQAKARYSWTLGCAKRIAERVDEKAYAERMESARRKATDDADRKARGDNTVGAMVLADVYSTEEDLNEDAYWELPAGTTARKRRERETARAAERAKAVPVTVSIPRALKPETETERKRRERDNARWERDYERRQQKARRLVDVEAFRAGEEEGGRVSLSEQLTGTKQARIK